MEVKHRQNLANKPMRLL